MFEDHDRQHPNKWSDYVNDIWQCDEMKQYRYFESTTSAFVSTNSQKGNWI